MHLVKDEPSPAPAGDHLVQFYEDDAFLAGRVAIFIARGLVARRPAIAIVTEPHRVEIASRLAQLGVDVVRERETGMLVELDAKATLETFMEDGRPDPTRFLRVIGGALDRSLKLGPRVHAFGEMVDLLWRGGSARAALELETLWNQLGATRPFSLLCGYSLSGFAHASDQHGLVDVCRAHSHVLPTRGDSEALEPGERAARVVQLEQKARALETELARRQDLEAALRRALDERRRAEAELKDFVETASMPMHWVGPDGTILWANDAELSMLGYSREEYVGENVTRFHVDQAAIADVLSRLARRETLKDHECRLLAKDGSIRHVLIDSSVYWRDGQFAHTRCFTRDITDRKNAERARDEFLAMLGHELRNPLSPILLALHVMRLRLGDACARERAIIERQVEHVVRLVDDLLDVSRITRGKLELKKRSMELSDAVASAVEMASPLLEERRHHLEVHVPATGLCIEGDAQRLAQVISNLLVNAAKYTEPEGRICIEGCREGAQAVVRVRDSGIGLAPELVPHLFDAFVQGHRGIDRAQGGLGLGLAIVKSLVALHGGSVEARSEGHGRGSEFTVRLPLSAQTTADVRSMRGPAPGVAAGARVLIVDDNTDAAEMLGEALSSLGYAVHVAYDGPSALQRAAEFAPQVALLDIGLPVMDGYEVARRLRELPSLAGVKLVAITGYGQESDRLRALGVGFDAHLVKPVEVASVDRELRRLFPPAT